MKFNLRCISLCYIKIYFFIFYIKESGSFLILFVCLIPYLFSCLFFSSNTLYNQFLITHSQSTTSALPYTPYVDVTCQLLIVNLQQELEAEFNQEYTLVSITHSQSTTCASRISFSHQLNYVSITHSQSTT